MQLPTWPVPALVVAFLFASGAVGQVLDPAVSVTAAIDHIEVPWNGTAHAVWSVQNDGPLEVDVTLAFDGSDVWEVAPTGSTEFTLAAGASQTVTATVSPVDALHTGSGTPAVALTATATDATGQQASDSAPIGTTFVPPPPPPPPDTTVRDVSLGALAALGPATLVYLIVGYLYKVEVPRAPTYVRGVRGAWIHVPVRNLAPWPQSVTIQTRGPGGAWQVAGDADRITMGSRKETTFTVFVRRLGEISKLENCRVKVRSRRGWLYPWRHHRSILIKSEPVDLTAWSASAIGAALDEATPANAMNGELADATTTSAIQVGGRTQRP